MPNPFKNAVGGNPKRFADVDFVIEKSLEAEHDLPKRSCEISGCLISSLPNYQLERGRMEVFQKLGSLVEARWKAQNYSEPAFPEIASQH